MSPALEGLLYPIKAALLSQKGSSHYKQRPKLSRATHVQTRVSSLRAEMFNLRPDKIMQGTSSDSVFLWKCDKAATKNGGNSGLINSVEVEEVDEAVALHQQNGHSVYCKSLQEGTSRQMTHTSSRNSNYVQHGTSIGLYLSSFLRGRLFSVAGVRRHKRH